MRGMILGEDLRHLGQMRFNGSGEVLENLHSMALAVTIMTCQFSKSFNCMKCSLQEYIFANTHEYDVLHTRRLRLTMSPTT